MISSFYPAWLIKDLRSNHAGEVGAVWIYRGILAISNDNSIRIFAQKHLETEQSHLREIEKLLPHNQRSRLLLFWKAAGFLTGLIPTLFSTDSTFYTIESVETFVDKHYRDQLTRLKPLTHYSKKLSDVYSTLLKCQSEEVKHRNEAAEHTKAARGIYTSAWCSLVSFGSCAAVFLARRC